MSEPGPRRAVTLRMLDRADKEIMDLARADIGAVYKFKSKFRQNPHSPGLHLKQLKGDSRLWSARVNDYYRAILLHVGDQHYLLVSVKHRSDVYDDLDRYSYHINRITGGIEVIDLAASATASSDGSSHPTPPSRQHPTRHRPSPACSTRTPTSNSPTSAWPNRSCPSIRELTDRRRSARLPTAPPSSPPTCSSPSSTARPTTRYSIRSPHRSRPRHQSTPTTGPPPVQPRHPGHHRRRRAPSRARRVLRPLAGLPAPHPAQARRPPLHRTRPGRRRTRHR